MRELSECVIGIASLVGYVADMSPTCRPTPTLSPFLERHVKTGDTTSDCREPSNVVRYISYVRDLVDHYLLVVRTLGGV